MEETGINDKKVFHDEYFSAKPSAVGLLAARLALLCVMSGSFVSIFCKLYGYSGNVLIPVSIAVGASIVLFTLTSLFPPVFVYGGVSAAGIAFIWIFRQQIYVGALYFWDYMMLKLDSRLLSTSGFFVHNEFRIRNGTVSEVLKMNEAFFWAAVILAVITALIFTAAVRTRYKMFVAVTAIVIVTAPAVASESAKFMPDFLVYLVCVFGFAAVSSSYDLDNGFIYGGKGSSARMSARRAEWAYRSRTRFFALKKRVNGDTERYYRYTPNFIAAVVVSAVVFFGVAAAVPEGAGISYKSVFDTIMSVGTEIMDRIGELFGTPIGSADDRNYFSNDEYGGITGSIGIDPPNSSDRAVLEVTLSRNDIPIYLRGDIGVDFTGTAWTSVASVTDRYNEAVADYFYPEAEYQVYRRYARYALGVEPDEVLPLQMVRVHYLRNTRVVFQPLAAFDLNYRDNGQYDCFGDSVLRMRSGFIGNFEGLALTPNICTESGWTSNRDEMLLDSVLSGSFGESESSALESGSISVPDMTNETYMLQMQNYRGFIDRTYKTANYSAIKKFVGIINGFYGSSESANVLSSLYGTDNVMRYRFARAVCEYFAKNFKYTLSADNGKDQLSGFLYSTHEGHCAMFATAMTLCMREMGFPARYVTGYVVYPGSGEQQKDGTFRCTLSERMLHAWVEVYFRGVGWLPFDPTVAVPGYAETVYGDYPPPAAATAGTTAVKETTPPENTTTDPLIETSAGETTPEPDTTAETSDDDDTTVPYPDDDGEDGGMPSHKDGFPELMIKLLPYIVIALVVIALVIIAVMFVRSVGRNERRMLASFRKLPPTEATALMYRFVLKLLALKRLEPENELIGDFAERADGSIEMKGSNAFMTDVVEIFEKCEFGSVDVSPVSEDERDAVWHYTSAVYKKVMGDLPALKRFFIKISLFL